MNRLCHVAFLAVLPCLCDCLQKSTVALAGSHSRHDVPQARSLEFPVGAHNKRQQMIVDMMKHAWNGYSKHCFGEDILKPLTKTCNKVYGVGLTIVDSIDTLYLMGMKDEYAQAREWIATNLDFSKVHGVNTFETTIRVLGGLLSMHSLTGDQLFLQKADEMGSRLYHAFDESGHHPPATDVDLSKLTASHRQTGIADATTLGMEFQTLAELTGQDKYAKVVDQVALAVEKLEKLDGVARNKMDQNYRLLGRYKIGSSGDSYYEYLLKQWLLSGRKEDLFLKEYKQAISGIQKHLVNVTSGPLHLTYVGEAETIAARRAFKGQPAVPERSILDKQMDHLVCWLPGTLALGAHQAQLSQEERSSHMSLARELVRTCYEMYKQNGKMLGPEIAQFEKHGQEIFIGQSESKDILRPETVESLFYLYRLDGNKTYQDWGWQMAQGIENYSKVEGGGYASLKSVHAKSPQKVDNMESFFLAETLKYLFLLFDDSRSQVPLDKYVFNTEAHPLRVMNETAGKRMQGILASLMVNKPTALNEWGEHVVPEVKPSTASHRPTHGTKQGEVGTHRRSHSAKETEENRKGAQKADEELMQFKQASRAEAMRSIRVDAGASTSSVLPRDKHKAAREAAAKSFHRIKVVKGAVKVHASAAKPKRARRAARR